MQDKNKNQENEKAQENPVELDGISQLKEIGLKEVSNKTFINLENLTALLEKDFAKLNRTKAMGFIQILQREFGVDLSELKTEYLQFNNAYIKPKKNYQTIETIDNDEQRPKKMLPYLLLGIAVAFASYLFFSNSDERVTIVPVDLNVVKNDIVTEEAKESLLAVDVVYEKETNDSEEVDLNKVVLEMFKATEDNETNTSEESNTEDMSDTNISEMIMPIVEGNLTLEKSMLTKVIESKKPIEKKETLVIPKKVKKPKKVKNENKGGLYIKPIHKAWVGVIFLDSMKKKDFLIRRPLLLDATKDQIILVGHKNFKIYNKQLEQGFKSKKMVMFLYKDGDLREISKKEYDRYRGKVRW